MERGTTQKVLGPNLSISFHFGTTSQFLREMHYDKQFQRSLTDHCEGMTLFCALPLSPPQTPPGEGVWAASAPTEVLRGFQGSAQFWAMRIWVLDFWPIQVLGKPGVGWF